MGNSVSLVSLIFLRGRISQAYSLNPLISEKIFCLLVHIVECTLLSTQEETTMSDGINSILVVCEPWHIMLIFSLQHCLYESSQ